MPNWNGSLFFFIIIFCKQPWDFTFCNAWSSHYIAYAALREREYFTCVLLTAVNSCFFDKAAQGF